MFGRRLHEADRVVVACERLLLALILLNTAVVVIGTVDGIGTRHGHVIRAVETVALTVFTVEFAVRAGTRLWRWDGRGSRIRTVADPYLVIDAVAILPFYVGILSGVGGLASSSLLRTLRLFKLARYVDAVGVFVRVFRRKRADLAVSVLGTGMLTLLAASSVYALERDVQPETFGSIPATLWWAGITITSVGYGDVYPVTPAGKVLAIVVSFLGLGLAAVPASILVSGLLAETGPQQAACPHCGRDLRE